MSNELEIHAAPHLTPYNPAAFEPMEGWEEAPNIFRITEESMIEAFLIGPGEPFKLADEVDKVTGEVTEKIVDTWVLRLADGTMIALFSSSQLARKLPPFVGCVVRIARARDIRVGGKIVSQYRVIAKRPTPANQVA